VLRAIASDRALSGTQDVKVTVTGAVTSNQP
jgi:hypothetical protein